MLPQGFKNSPTLFGETLAVDLSTFLEENPSCTLLQYMDDLLLASHDQEKCWEGTKALLAQLSEQATKFPGKRPKFVSKRSNTTGSSFQNDDML
jgi:hypothetical protein